MNKTFKANYFQIYLFFFCPKTTNTKPWKSISLQTLCSFVLSKTVCMAAKASVPLSCLPVTSVMIKTTITLVVLKERSCKVHLCFLCFHLLCFHYVSNSLGCGVFQQNGSDSSSSSLCGAQLNSAWTFPWTLNELSLTDPYNLRTAYSGLRRKKKKPYRNSGPWANPLAWLESALQKHLLITKRMCVAGHKTKAAYIRVGQKKKLGPKEEGMLEITADEWLTLCSLVSTSEEINPTAEGISLLVSDGSTWRSKQGLIYSETKVFPIFFLYPIFFLFPFKFLNTYFILQHVHWSGQQDDSHLNETWF